MAEEALSFMHAVDGRPKREKTLPKRFDPRSALQDPMSTKQTRAKRTNKSRGGILVGKLPWVTNSLGPPWMTVEVDANSRAVYFTLDHRGRGHTTCLE